jgi:pimeloyl-ACP methyl ester carboxylesterase
LELPGTELLPLPWLTPKASEPVGEYAGRMRAGISGDRPVLIGVSFGGMMAIEIAKKLPGAIVILVSSVRDHSQLPLWIKWGGRLYPRWLNPRMRRPPAFSRFLENHFMGVESDDDGRLVKEFQNMVDRPFLFWAVHAIARWRNCWIPPVYYHIHGGADKMFPIKKVQPTHVIPDGGHLMVYNRAEAVSRMLREILAGEV